MFLTPMELGDVWWHLKTGEWIIEHRGLPAVDPFSIAFPPVENPAVLKAFWLSELCMHFVERASGFIGLIAFKSALFTAALYLTYRVITAYGLSQPLAGLLLVPVAVLATAYDEMRPQTFTFFFFALTVYLLEKRCNPGDKDGAAPPYRAFNVLLPISMLLWANMHGGFVLGDGVIALYALREALKPLFGKPRVSGAKSFFLVCALSLAASFINPGIAGAFAVTLGMLRSATPNAPIHEHLPVGEFVKLTGEGYIFYTEIAIAAVVSAGFVLALLRRARPDALHAVLVSGLALVAFKTFRGGFFFAVIGAVALGKNLSMTLRKPWVGEKPIRAVLVSSILGLAVAGYFFLPRTILKAPVIDDLLIPVKTADFIEREKLPANLFHPYEWGGYFIWRLYPRYRVFIDGRAMGLMEEYSIVGGAEPGWRQILDRYKINTVVYWTFLPFKDRVPPIVLALLEDPGWSAVYWDFQSVGFVRTPLAKNPVRKGAVWELLTSMVGASISKSPGDPSKYVSLGEVYARRGMGAEAERAFRKALELDPANREAIGGLRGSFGRP